MFNLAVRLGAGVTVLALGLTACDGDGAGDEPGSADASPSDTASPTGAASQSGDASPADEETTSDPLRLTDADVIRPGEGLRLVGRTSETTAPHTHVGVDAVTPDGELVVSVMRRNLENPLDLNQGKVALRDPETGELKFVSQGEGRDGNQISGVDVNRRWITWLETPSTNLYNDPWTLYSHDRKTGQNRKLGTAPQVGKRNTSPMVDGYSQPTIVDGRVYVAAVGRIATGSPIPSVYSVALDGTGSLREEYRGEILPEAGRGTVVTLDARRSKGKHRGTWLIKEHDVNPDRSRMLASGSGKVSDLLRAGDTTAWFSRRNGTTRLHVLTADSETPRVVVETDRNLSYPTMTSRYLTFQTGMSNTGTGYLYDFETAELHRITQGRMTAMQGHGPYVVWHNLNRRSSDKTTLAKLTDH